MSVVGGAEPGLTIEDLSGDVEVPSVAGDLLDHVQDDISHRVDLISHVRRDAAGRLGAKRAAGKDLVRAQHQLARERVRTSGTGRDVTKGPSAASGSAASRFSGGSAVPPMTCENQKCSARPRCWIKPRGIQPLTTTDRLRSPSSRPWSMARTLHR